MKRYIFLYNIIMLISFLSIWEYFAKQSVISGIVFPAPTQIFEAAWQSLSVIYTASLYTFQNIINGIILAICLSSSITLLMIYDKKISMTAQPIFILLQCIPMFTLAPLIVLWFGWGSLSIVVPTALTIFFPLTLAFYQGLKSTPKELLNFFQLHDASYFQTLLKLRIPYALPHIFSGLKITITTAGFATTAAEWVSATKGLGILILESRRNYDAELTFASLISLGILIIALYLLVIWLEKIIFHIFRINIKSKKKKVFTKINLAFIFLSILAWQGKNYFSKHQICSSIKPLKLLLDWTPGVNHVPLYVGLEKNFFAEENLLLEIMNVADSVCGVQHLLFNKVDMTLYHAIGCLQYKLKGCPLQVIGHLIDSSLSGIISREDANVKTIHDFNNKTLGICCNGSDRFQLFLKQLEKQEIVFKSIKNVSSDMLSPFVLNKIDCLFGAFHNIEGVKLSSLGAHNTFIPASDYDIHIGPQLLVCAKQGSIATQPQFILSFKRALAKSIEFCIQNPDEAFKIYAKATLKSEKTQILEYEQWKRTYPLLAKTQNPIQQKDIEPVLKTIFTMNPALSKSPYLKNIPNCIEPI